MRSRTSFYKSSRPPYFDLAPLAGVFFALNCLLLLVYFPSEPRRGLASIEETPYYCPACFNVPTEASIVVSLAASGGTSFATFNASLQVAALKLVSQQYGVSFSATDINSLEKLLFLAVKVEQLPSILTNADDGIAALNLDRNYPGLTDEQLVSCVQVARKLAPAYTQQTADIFLLIDARTDASKVMHLFHILQNQGISRFNLIAHCQ
jgi:biopolymer transport protein ExbD